MITLQTCFFLSIALFLISVTAFICLTRNPGRAPRFFTPFRVFAAGVFLAAAVLFFPSFFRAFEPLTFFSGFSAVLLSAHTAMRVFVLDGDFEIISVLLNGTPEWLELGYAALASFLYVLCPVLTSSFVLSFFQNISFRVNVLVHYWTDTYVFSELSQRSLALAKSIHEQEKSAFIIFTDVCGSDDESGYELQESAREMGAICIKNDITKVGLTFHSTNSKISFFAIGEDESENTHQALQLVHTYGATKNRFLYIFSSNTESELLFSTISDGGMRVRRIDSLRSLINETLYHSGHFLFEEAAEMPDGTKKISAVILGLGSYGTEMLRALPWYCQMPGYDISIHAFDLSPHAESLFTAKCPELMSPLRNGIKEPGEAAYSISIHSGLDISSPAFREILSSLDAITYVFVALGEDLENIAAAAEMRVLCERLGKHRRIQSAVYDSAKVSALESVTDYRGHRYDLDFIGDLRTSFSAQVIINSELEKKALERHLRWGDEREFWRYEFNYRSSIASAIHAKARIACGIDGADVPPEERTEAQIDTICRLEHNRWNAYMRSEGFVYSGSTEKSSRNDLAKMHNCLVPFDTLSRAEQLKDNS